MERGLLLGGASLESGRVAAAQSWDPPSHKCHGRTPPKMPGGPQTRCCGKGQEQKPDQACAGLPFPSSPNLRSVSKIKNIKMEYFLIHQPLSPPEVPYTHTSNTLEREFPFSASCLSIYSFSLRIQYFQTTGSLGVNRTWEGWNRMSF